MHDSDIATAADYADAMLTARRAKHVLVLLLILVIMGQIAVFFAVKYDLVKISEAPVVAAMPAPTTEVATTTPAEAPAPRMDFSNIMHYVTAACLAIGLLGTLVLSFVLLLIVNIMLVGRLIGVARLASAYLWCIVLVVLLFPWQSFLDNQGLTPDKITWKWPGVLYTWGELMQPAHGAKFVVETSKFAILKWVRFVGFPVIALMMLLVIQFKSNKGMRQALGEEESLSVEG